jgi:hypothetical protein
MTKEEKINFIRFGPADSMKFPKKVAVNLLEKYKPMINLDDFKEKFNEFDKEEIKN